MRGQILGAVSVVWTNLLQAFAQKSAELEGSDVADRAARIVEEGFEQYSLDTLSKVSPVKILQALSDELSSRWGGRLGSICVTVPKSLEMQLRLESKEYGYTADQFACLMIIYWIGHNRPEDSPANDF